MWGFCAYFLIYYLFKGSRRRLKEKSNGDFDRRNVAGGRCDKKVSAASPLKKSGASSKKLVQKLE
jgi:hypothetical protein